MNKTLSIPTSEHKSFWHRYLPALNWLSTYNRSLFSNDLLAGTIVAIMLVPQGMAYALLAGLPPEVGLYASIVPLVIYGLMGSSRSLAVGPVAMVSLLVASGLAPLAAGDIATFIQLALTLALIVGLLQTLMGILRIGFIVNFLSHPVLSGFTSAAAIIIGFSQLKHLLGISLPSTESFFAQTIAIIERLPQTNGVTASLAISAIAILLFFKYGTVPLLKRMGVGESWILPISKIGPLVAVVFGTTIVWWFELNQYAGVQIVGSVPAGAPSLSMPTIDWGTWQLLLPTALAISLVGYMESISVAKSLASKRREKVEPDQELLALGMANLGAAFSGGYPVTGGISRSVVNFTAGARTGMASLITAGFILLTVLFLTPIFFFLPRAILGAIIIVAVVGMIDFQTFIKTWRYNKGDGISLLVTFLAVLTVGVETGILYGAGIAMVFYIWRSSQPHMAIVGRLDNSEIYRNILRHDVQTYPQVLTLRIDESLYFANTRALEEMVLGLIAERPQVKHFVLIGTAINFIDASALETLELLLDELRDSGVEFHLAAIKGPVLDKLETAGFTRHFGEDHIHLTTHDAMRKIGCVD